MNYQLLETANYQQEIMHLLQLIAQGTDRNSLFFLGSFYNPEAS
jgi:hypothetical protein